MTGRAVGSVLVVTLLAVGPAWSAEQEAQGRILSPSPITEESQQGQAIKGAVVAKDSKGVIVRGDPSGHEVSLTIGAEQLRDIEVGDTIEAQIKDGQVASVKKAEQRHGAPGSAAPGP